MHLKDGVGSSQSGQSEVIGILARVAGIDFFQTSSLSLDNSSWLSSVMYPSRSLEHRCEETRSGYTAVVKVVRVC